MMNQTRNLLVLSLLLCMDTAAAFSLGTASTTRTTSTCLFLSESAENGGANDILNSPAFLKRKMEVLQSDIAKVEEDIKAAKQRLEEGKAEWGGQLDALQEEYQNIQVRLNEQNKKGGSMATVQVAREVLKVLDNFDRAFGAIKAETETQIAIEQEYRQTYNQILNILSDLGVEEVATVGTEFDYQVHQAVMQMPTDEYEEGIVCGELQKGFKLGETLIRAAMVQVAV